jgi:dTDP-4-amino-4,6-dideoxygalactose transaminase
LRIPLVDLRRQSAQVKEQVEAGWAKVLSESSFILGEEVVRFEEAFAEFCGVSHCIGVGNGTDAIELAIRALGIGPGDEVIVPANTFIATALGALRAGASVKLVDCLPGSYLIDPERVASAITKRTRAILPVHLFGQVAPVEELRDFDLPIIEDAAQAQGAERHGHKAGSLGVIAGTSFYPAKNLGAFGDAGAVMTNSEELASRVRRLRNWGSDVKYHHPVIGFNSRLDSLQAVVLSAKLALLETWNKDREATAARYDRWLSAEERIQTPLTLTGNRHVYHLYVVEVDDRARVMASLHESGIEAGIHYPVPIHLQQALAHLGHRVGDFLASEAAADRMISLPIFPGITEDEQAWVAERLIGAVT